jgi:hypothetical protein
VSTLPLTEFDSIDISAFMFYSSTMPSICPVLNFTITEFDGTFNSTTPVSVTQPTVGAAGTHTWWYDDISHKLWFPVDDNLIQRQIFYIEPVSDYMTN